MAGLEFELVWFDSLGAKSASVLVRACGRRILIDPGIAVMHPSFPASREAKEAWYREGLQRILHAAREADIIIVTHYHHDHYLHREEHLAAYLGKMLLAKNPNSYINESQRSRAEQLYTKLYRLAGLEEVYGEPLGEAVFPDPGEELQEALSRSFGDYEPRRRELLEKGRQWFRKLSSKWAGWRQIREAQTGRLKVYWADGRTFELGCVRVRFTKPLFHGVEYSRVGWVLAVVVEAGGVKLLYSSDVNGPIVEDYASLIIRENPNILILDGPPTYMLGYMLNNINLRRAVENAARIVTEASRLKLVIYDHHLTREPRFRERTREAWEAARRAGVRMVTAAEYLGKKPAVLAAGEGRGTV